MATVDDERYLRYVWLLGEGGLFSLRCVITIETTNSGNTLESLLRNNSRLFNNILREQKLQLFPTSRTVNADVDTWDMSLLFIVLKRIFWSTISLPMKNAIESLKTYRNNFQGHPPRMSMSATDYDTNRKLLVQVLRHISSGNVDTEDVISRTESGIIDIQSVFKYMKELSTIDRTVEKLLKEMTDLKQMFLRSKMQDYRKELDTIIEAKCENEEKSNRATDVLFDFVKIIGDDGTFTEDEIRENIRKRIEWYGCVTLDLINDVIKWFGDINGLPEAFLGCPRSGSILIPISYRSETGLHNILTYMNKDESKQRLSNISSTISRLLGFSCSLSWNVVSFGLQKTMSYSCLHGQSPEKEILQGGHNYSDKKTLDESSPNRALRDSDTQSIEEFSGIEQPPLLEQIKRILDEYRNDVQIIKELIQNADDAEATAMSILYEGRTINPERDDESEYCKFLRAPALVFYNNKTFTDDDWRGIRSIYKSVKRDDPLKIGRFGLGFKSVFHLTDYPCIISGENALFINPHAKEFGRICVMVKLKNLKAWHRLNNNDYINSLSDTFWFGEDTLTSGHYNGTMFWFPLRQFPSTLSENTYPEENVYNLLHAFISESDRSLLFLKTLSSIKLYVDMPAQDNMETVSSEISNQQLSLMNLGKETHCFAVDVSNKSNDIQRERKSFLNDLLEIGNEVPDVSKQWVFDITIRKSTNTISEEVSKVAKSRWLIVNYLKGGEISEKLGLLMTDKDLGYPHIVGLAASIDEDSNFTSTSGHVFCYQPLPQENVRMTGLPVHVNGFFALSQNRRHVRWPDQGDTTHGQGDKKIEWNMELVSQILPESYERLLIELVTLCKKEGNPEYLLKAVYKAVPDLSVVGEHWHSLANRVPKLCKDRSIFYTEQGGGIWIQPQDAVVVNPRKCENHTDNTDEYTSTIFDLLISDKINAIVVPDHVSDAFDQTGYTLRYATPAYLKSHMALSHHDTYKSLDLDKKQDLFEFVMLDSATEGLDGLELLPLADGTFRTFKGSRVILEGKDIVDLFPDQESYFVHTNLREKTRDFLTDLVEKGGHCLKALCDDSTVTMVTNALNINFGQREKIQVDNSECKKWANWVRNIWCLIQSRFRDTMQKFINCSIFPIGNTVDLENVSDIILTKLSTNILHLPSYSQLDDKTMIKQSLHLLSVSVIEHVPNYIDTGLISSFLHDETSEGITSLLDRITSEEIKKFNSEVSDECSASLLKFLSERIHTTIRKMGKQILRDMRLFRGFKTQTQSDLVSLRETDNIYAGKTFPVDFPAKMIMLKSNEEKSLVERLDANFVSEIELVRKTMRNLNEYDPHEQQKFAFWIITNGEHFKYHDVQEALKDIHFLESHDGLFYRPGELFDPSEDILRELFNGESVFANVTVENEQKLMLLNGLKQLGLKSVQNLSSENIYHVCDVVHKMTEENVDVDIPKCKALLSVMNKHSNLLRKEALHNKRCIIIEDKMDDICSKDIPLKNRQNEVPDAEALILKPNEIHSAKHVSLIGSVMFIIDCKHLSSLADVFDWTSQPNVSCVLQHFNNIIRHYQPQFKALYLPIVISIYDWLSNQDEIEKDDLKDMIKDHFSKPRNPFVWDGSTFQLIENMYIESTKGDVDLKPFLYPLPSELQNFVDFFLQLGCQQSIRFDTYVDILQKIRESEQRTIDHKDLEETFTAMAIAILNRIKKSHFDDCINSEKELYFPTISDNGGIEMITAASCTFCDEQWLKNMDFQFDGDIKYIHPDLPISTAEALGVPSLRKQMMSDTEAFAEWGQEEPLTRRLRNLLKEGYVDGFSVAKELFQNADDAEAKTIYILFDERENNDAKTGLISDKMAECQGPAIWIYNDALFTESDFKNITKLSGATKENDSTKIGKFGLGFCAVYNVTDVPSFISGESIVFFDPDMSHLENVLPGRSPGLRVNFRKLSNLKMLKSLRNQFKPFEGVFGCKILDTPTPYFNGTLFRLPLRNKASDISDVVYTSKEVKGLFEKIMPMAANMLLFNQNVVDFKLLHIPKTGYDLENPKLLFEVHKNATRLCASDDEGFNAVSMLVEASKRKQAKSLLESPLQVIERISVNINAYVDSKLDTRVEENEITEDWLISWSTGKEENSVTLSYEEKGSLPLGAVAIPLRHSNDSNVNLTSLSMIPEYFYQIGHLFFFLPLPIQHNFPFHINSQFTVTSDRRQLRTSTEDDKNMKMTQWNRYLIEDSVIQALLFLLAQVHEHVSTDEYDFTQFWPMHESAKVLEHLPIAFYKNVVKPGAYDVFEKNGQWFDISRCIFIEKSLRVSKIGDMVFEVLSMFSDFVVDVPGNVYDMLSQADPLLIDERTIAIEAFFLDYLFPNLEDLSSEQDMKEKRKQLLYYAVDLQNSAIDPWLKQNKCIPSQPYGILKCPYELIDASSPFAKLFATTDGYFPEFPFTDKLIALKLQNLGLMLDVLSDEIVLDRANSIKPLNAKCLICSVERSGLMLCYLGNQMSRHRSISNDLSEISFIPVQARPHGWQPEWHADLLQLKKIKTCKLHNKIKDLYKLTHFDRPSKVFDSHCKNIVGCVAFVFENSSFKKLFSRRDDEKEMLRSIGMNGVTKFEVDVNIVINQLLSVAQSYKGMTSDTSSNGIYMITNDIYSHIDHACKSKDKTDEIAKAIRQEAIVFVSSTFVTPDLVARHCRSNCAPFLFKLDDSPLKYCKSLYECLGIADRFKPSFVALVLQRLKNDKGVNSLCVAEIQKVIAVLSCLKDSIEILHGTTCEVKSIFSEEIEAVYGPDENGILRDCTTMCFNDFDGIEKSESMIYSHISFPADLAKFFGVNPKLIHSFEECSDDIEDFYQDEPLVVRLNRLVDGYPCDSGIFKELIQNADDANASEIHFIKDYTIHPQNNIISQEYGALQGPALLVYNNSAFSQKDLKGIQSLGRGSKSDDPSQTGRYGVGFNAVYNLTDCPSFYTKGGDIENEETLCIFDPLAKYLPNVTRKKPGKRIKNVKWVRHIYSDMMTGFHENELMKHSSGTIFRFPLRTLEMAKTSEIKNESVDIETISQMLNVFSKEISNVLLFLKNLKSVKISTCFNNNFVEEVCIKVEMEPDEISKQSTFVEHQKQICEKIKREKESLFQFDQFEETYKLSINERRIGQSTKSNYIVVQVFGLNKDFEINKTVKDNILNGKLGLLPLGGVALQYSKGKSEFNEVYWESSGACKAFCFLPLPIETGLSVHVHGYFALDHETRRTLWRSEDAESCYKSSWNNMLIKHVISTAYVCLLNYTKEIQFRGITDKNVPSSIVSDALSNFQTLFPRKDDTTDTYWKHLLVCVYQQLVARRVPFLPALNLNKTKNFLSSHFSEAARLTWTPLNTHNSSFPAYIKEEKYDGGVNLNAILCMLGMRIVFIPKEISDAMEYAGVPLTMLEPSHVIEFVRTPDDHCDSERCESRIKTDEYVIKTDLKSVENAVEVLSYCLKDYECFNKNLKHIPLLVTQEGKVQTVPENGFYYVEPMSRFCDLFPSKRHLFLNSSISNTLSMYMLGKETKFQGKLKRFDLNEFVRLAKETGQLNENVSSDETWAKTNPPEKWIRIFWDFFTHQLPGKEKEKFVSEQLQIVQSLPLLPIGKTLSDDQFLIQPRNIKFLINLGSFVHNEMLYTAMKNLHLKEISRIFFENNTRSNCYELLQRKTANFKNPLEIIECLHFNSCQKEITNLPDEHVKEILWYFDKSQLDTFSQRALVKLKGLPLFVSHFGQRVTLTHYSEIYIVPRNLYSQGLKDIADKANVLFLRDTGQTNLFKHLAIEKLSLTKLYAEYIIPLQHFLERKCFYTHICFLSRETFNEKDEYDILEVLRKSAFVETLDGRMVRVCDLYDSEHKVFKRMCEAKELVPECLRNYKILILFRRIGLKACMSMELYIRFARSIEVKGNKEGLSEAVREESKLLSTSLWGQDKSFYKRENLSTLSKIKFLIPGVVNEKLTAIKCQYNINQLICFEESVPYCSSNISWTVSNILPNYLDTRLMFQQTDIRTEKLNIHLQPQLDKFMCHCEHVGKSLEKIIEIPKTVCHEMLAIIMVDIYDALKKFHDDDQITDDMVETLRCVPIVYFPRREIILTAKSVVIRCEPEEEIPPFLLQCPEKYQNYKGLFLRLGASSKPTSALFARVLYELKTIAKETELNPFESSNAAIAMRWFVKYLVKKVEVTDMSIDKLYLLSCNNTLEDAKSVVVRNNKYFERQLQKCVSVKCVYLIGFEELHEYFLKIEDFVESLQYLPDKYRPHLLTDVVTERVLLEQITYQGHQHSSLYKDFLHSSHFVHGFLRLTRHVWKCKGKQLTETNEKEISKQILTIDIQQCSGIKTKLALKCIENGNLGKESFIENTSEDKFIHIEKTEEGVCIYFDTAKDFWENTLTKTLTIFLNGLVGDCLENTYFVMLMEIISKVKTPELIPLFLSKENIEQYTLLCSEIDTNPSCPTPGYIVPKKFHQYLDNGYGIIYEHEYNFIALEVDDPGLNLEGDENDEEEPEDANKDFDLTYKFVHIIRMIGQRHELPLFQEYEINYGSEETTIVRAHKLFKFIRKSKFTPGTGTTVTLYERDSKQQSDDSSVPSSLKEAYREIRKIIRAAWQKDVTERNAIVKRLYLKWHPDKNQENVQFCTKVFQYIRQCLDRLEKGLALVDDDGNEFYNQSSSSWSGSNGNSRYDRYWRRYQKSERYHNSRYSYSNDSTSSSTSSSSSRYYFTNFDDTWSHWETHYEPYHWHSRAREWYRQAEYDLQNVMASIKQRDNPQYNWVCYNSHQAAEKALKAAWYAKDANKINGIKTSHNIASIASDLGLSIETYATRLSGLLGEHTRMRYPDDFLCNLPAETYSEQQAISAIAIAEEILKVVKSTHIKK